MYMYMCIYMYVYMYMYTVHVAIAIVILHEFVAHAYIMYVSICNIHVLCYP